MDDYMPLTPLVHRNILNDLKRSGYNLAELFDGSEEEFAEIMAGRHVLSASHIKILSKKFKIPIERFNLEGE